MFRILLGPACSLILLAAPVSFAHAQLMNQLKSATGSGAGSGLLGGSGGLPSVNQASPSNIAGVLQYCIQNNYLSGGSASSVKNSLVSKLGSGGSTSNSGFKAGSSGMLESGSGQGYSLGGGGIKQEATKKVCDLVLQHAKSLL